jgi:predicted ester cyclase
VTVRVTQEDAAMPPSAGTIFRLWFDEVWNQRDPSRIATYFAPGGIAYAADLYGADVHGPAAFRAFFEQFLQSFSDVHFTVEDVWEFGNKAAGRWTLRLTHSGDGFGFTASGVTAKVTGMTMIRVEGGMIVEGWNEWDRMRLASACGMVKPA